MEEGHTTLGEYITMAVGHERQKIRGPLEGPGSSASMPQSATSFVITFTAYTQLSPSSGQQTLSSNTN